MDRPIHDGDHNIFGGTTSTLIGYILVIVATTVMLSSEKPDTYNRKCNYRIELFCFEAIMDFLRICRCLLGDYVSKFDTSLLQTTIVSIKSDYIMDFQVVFVLSVPE